MREREGKRLGIFVFILLIMAPFWSFGQERDTTVGSKNLGKVILMVIPYNPQMYVVAGDQFICNRNNLNPGKLNDMFRRSFTLALMEDLNNYYDVSSPIDNLKDPNSDISVLYQIFKYKTKYKPLRSYAREYPPLSLWKKLGPAYMRWGSDCVNNSSPKPKIHHHKYQKATITSGKDSIYASIMNFHDATYSLVITQFEMTTRFKTCLDLQNNVFQRDFYVDYTLLNFDGKAVDGGVVGLTYQSNTNDVQKILEHNMILLAEMISTNIRNKIPNH